MSVLEPLSREVLAEALARPSPEFDAWRDRMPDGYWARHDLSACKLGWIAGREELARPRLIRFLLSMLGRC